ncbi:MAG: tetratricopeptide repeat protein [Muribaculaceae bacterium]|nr:tetratricopeptide repeat protein [Muribaculaceae bacterium]
MRPRPRHIAAAILVSAAAVCFGTDDKLPTSAIADSPAARYLALADSATTFMDSQHWESARQCLIKALRLQPGLPTNSLIYSNLGVCQTNLGMYGEALHSFEIALVKSPNSPTILSNRARTHLIMNSPADALTDLNDALAADSLFSNALRLRSTLLLQRGDFAGAEADYSRLNTLQPQEAWTLSALGRCAYAQGDPKRGENLLQEALKCEPDAETYVSIALTQLDVQDMQSLEETLRQGIKHYPREGMLYLLRAVTEREKFQNEDAEIDKKIASDYGVDPQIIDALFGSPARKKR